MLLFAAAEHQLVAAFGRDVPVGRDAVVIAVTTVLRYCTGLRYGWHRCCRVTVKVVVLERRRYGDCPDAASPSTVCRVGQTVRRDVAAGLLLLHRQTAIALLAVVERNDRFGHAVVTTADPSRLHRSRLAVEERLWDHSHVLANLDVGLCAA